MNILFVVTKADLGGAQRFVFDLAHFFHTHGHQVTVGYGVPGSLTERLKEHHIPTHHFKHLTRNLNPFSAYLFSRELRKKTIEQGYDIVHFNSSNTFPGVFSLKNLLAKPRTIATLHGLSFIAPEHASRAKPVYALLYRHLLYNFNETVYLTERDQKNAVQQGLPVGTIIPLGIAAEPYLSREKALSELQVLNNRIQPDRFIVGAVGRLAYPKNIIFLIEHFTQLRRIIPNVQLVLIGDGPDRAYLESHIAEKKLTHDIILLGAVPQASRYLQAFNLLIVPSTYEGVPYIVLEALAAQIPVLASAVGGLPEVLPPSHLFKLTTEDFIDQLEKLANNNFPIPTAHHEHTLSSMAEKYLKLYHHTL